MMWWWALAVAALVFVFGVYVIVVVVTRWNETPAEAANRRALRNFVRSS